jgi:choline-glycine betaine transporter
MPLLAIAAEILLGEFLLPWGIVVSALGFFAAWISVIAMEHLRLTRYVANLPVFFIALVVLFGCVIGLSVAP